jgi:hypothetical protein
MVLSMLPHGTETSVGEIMDIVDESMLLISILWETAAEFPA